MDQSGRETSPPMVMFDTFDQELNSSGNEFSAADVIDYEKFLEEIANPDACLADQIPNFDLQGLENDPQFQSNNTNPTPLFDPNLPFSYDGESTQALNPSNYGNSEYALGNDADVAASVSPDLPVDYPGESVQTVGQSTYGDPENANVPIISPYFDFLPLSPPTSVPPTDNRMETTNEESETQSQSNIQTSENLVIDLESPSQIPANDSSAERMPEALYSKMLEVWNAYNSFTGQQWIDFQAELNSRQTSSLSVASSTEPTLKSDSPGSEPKPSFPNHMTTPVGVRRSSRLQGSPAPRPDSLKPISSGICKKPQRDSRHPNVRINPTTQGKNKRSTNIQSVDPSVIYDQSPWEPYPWGDIFDYTEHGELRPGQTFETNAIVKFLYENPRRDNLRIWIQRSPADSARRTGSYFAAICRFKGCPIQGNKIGVGFPRLAFDERTSSDLYADPYHNAGYVHLYCAERFLDFPQLVKDLLVQVDDRGFRRGDDNKMELEYPLREAAKAFVKDCSGSSCPPSFSHISGNLQDSDPYDSTLCKKLYEAKLANEPCVRKKTRQNRGDKDTHWDNHMGDLSVLASAKVAQTEQKRIERQE